MKQFINSGFLQKVIVLLLLLFCYPVQAEDEKKQLSFGIHPYLPATILLERFTPLIDYLEKQTGYIININICASYQDHIEKITQGKHDFAYMGPAPYVKLTEKIQDYPLLGRLSFADKNTFRGAIITRQNSQISTIKDLKGKNFAFGDPESTLSYKVPLRLLEEAEVKLSDLKNYSHLKNHHDVVLAVLMGKYEAGSVKEEVFHQYKARGLKVLQWSPGFPSHLIVANRNIDKALLHKLTNLLQELHRQPEGSKILQQIKKGTTAIIPAHIEEYAQLRQFLTFEEVPELQFKPEHQLIKEQ